MRGLAVWVALTLAGCGGGGGGGSSGDGGSTTSLPSSVVLSVPSGPQALGATLAFSSNAIDPGLTYRWDFGDGSTDGAAAPTHAYAKAGVFTVRLTLGNASGATVGSTATVSVSDFAIVAGKVCSGAGHAGWCWQRPLPQNNPIADYTFSDDSHGWAVGEAGTVLATTDGGVTWNGQMSGTTLDLFQVSFPSASAGWIAGTAGEMLRTADGGASWQRRSFGHNDFLVGFGASDANTAWVTTFLNTTYVTTDGGTQWKQIVPPPDSYRLVVVGPTDIWSLPQFIGGQPALAHSTDGGATWSPVALPATEDGLAGYLQELQFSDPSHAVVTGFESGFPASDPGNFVIRQTIRLTADRGATWQTVTAPPGNNYSYRLGGATLYAFSAGLPALRTTDAGTTWQTLPLPMSGQPIYSLGVLTADRLIAIDGTGQAWLTVDGGAHWNLRSAGGGGAYTVSGVWFFDNRAGIAVALDGGLLRTADGGQTWSSAGALGYGNRRLQFLADGSVGWMTNNASGVLRSTDRGSTWLAPAVGSNPPTSVTDVHFVDALRGWTIAPYGVSGSEVHASTDGGITWKAVSTGALGNGFVSVRFLDALHGVAVGPAGVAMVTADGGVTFSPRPTGVAVNLRQLTVADAVTLVAVGDGGSVVRSTDAGQTWTPVATPVSRSLTDVRFVSPLVGHAVGDAGSVLVTRDGGRTWSLRAPGTRVNLQSVFFLDEQTGWVAGDNGAILATATGGQ